MQSFPDYQPIIRASKKRFLKDIDHYTYQNNLNCFSLWSLHSGIISIQIGQENAQRYTGSDCFFFSPEIEHKVDIPTGSEISYLEFTLIPRAKYGGEYKTNITPLIETIEQPSMDGFGLDAIQFEIPQAMMNHTHNVVRECCETAWRNDLYFQYANAQLTLWFKQYLLYMNEQNKSMAPRPKSTSDWLEAIESKARMHIAYNPSCKQLATWANLSTAQFYRVYTKARGRSPGQFLLQCKMEEAAHLLLHTELDIASVSRKAGYQSPKTFSLQFKKFHKTTPTEYRHNTRRQTYR